MVRREQAEIDKKNKKIEEDLADAALEASNIQSN